MVGLGLGHEFGGEGAALELCEVDGGEKGVVEDAAGGPFLHADASGVG